MGSSLGLSTDVPDYPLRAICGSGYPTINRELEAALLDSPVVSSTLDEFDLIIHHRKMTEEEGAAYTRDHTEQAIIAYLSEHESSSALEIADAAGVTAKTVRAYINPLIDQGLVEGIGTKTSPKRRYRLIRR